MGGELTFGAFPITRSDGELLANKVFSVNANGNIGLYDITIFSPPYIDETVINFFSPSQVLTDWHLNGDFFTLNTTIKINGVTIFTTYLSSKLMLLTFTTNENIGSYDIEINNGILKIYHSFIRVITGTAYPVVQADWITINNLSANVDGGLDIINTTSHLYLNNNVLGEAQLNRVFNYLIDWEYSWQYESDSLYPLGHPSGLVSMAALRTISGNVTIFQQLFDSTSGDKCYESPAYTPYAITPIFGRYADTYKVRWLAGVLYFYVNNTINRTAAIALTENMYLTFTLGSMNLRNIIYTEL
ncbi:hypothetical protein GW932_05400 [archaeon]|nr:hypothetical protein [archaeon]